MEGSERFAHDVARIAEANQIRLRRASSLLFALREDVDAGAVLINIYRGSRNKSKLLIVTSTGTWCVTIGVFGATVPWHVPHGELEFAQATHGVSGSYVVDELRLFGSDGIRASFRFGFNNPEYEFETQRNIDEENCQTAADDINEVAGTSLRDREADRPVTGHGSAPLQADSHHMSPGTIADQLATLAALHSTGALTDREFNEAKARLLFGPENPRSTT